MKRFDTIHAGAMVAVSAAAMLCANPAAANPAADVQPVRKVAADKAAAAAANEPKKKVTTTQGSAGAQRSAAIGSFTPSTLDNVRRTTASGAASAQERTFRFTPSGKTNDRKALALGVTSRVVRAVAPESARPAEIETASAYNFDVSVGFNGFAISGGYSRLDSMLQDGREGVDLGLSYRGGRWKTALQLNAEHDADGWTNPLSLDKRYTVELGGAYALSSRLSVLGGVRYQMMEPDASGRYLLRGGEKLSNEGNAGAVYLGTSISF